MMQQIQLFKKYMIKLGLLSAGALMLYGIALLLLPEYVIIDQALIIPYFIIVSGGVHYYLLKSRAQGNARKFVTRFMGTTTFKLLLYMATLLVYVLVFRDTALKFVIAFFIYYLMYTSFEVVVFLKQSKEVHSSH
jgi:L-asparagine transporter-like permease